MEIGDFVSGLPEIDHDEAKIIYKEAENVEHFLRVELEARFSTIDAGMKMVYVIGKGLTIMSLLSLPLPSCWSFRLLPVVPL